jgi:hypothetical protein
MIEPPRIADRSHRTGTPSRHNRRMARLVDVVSALASADPEATIYVAMPASPYSNATVSADDRGVIGLAYLLEVSLAREVLDVWARWRNGREPTPEEAAGAIIYYAQHDAYEPIRPTA